VRPDVSLLVAVVVAAALASGNSTHRGSDESAVEAAGSTARPSPVAEARSPLIDYLNAVGAATAAADPSMDTLSALPSGTTAESLRSTASSDGQR
jgi:hypothetical protein